MDITACFIFRHHVHLGFPRLPYLLLPLEIGLICLRVLIEVKYGITKIDYRRPGGLFCFAFFSECDVPPMDNAGARGS